MISKSLMFGSGDAVLRASSIVGFTTPVGWKKVQRSELVIKLAIAEFEEYVLIYQNQVLVERFQRKANSLRVPTIYRMGDIGELSSIRFSCPISHLYEDLGQLL
jgi:hypothetical protein